MEVHSNLCSRDFITVYKLVYKIIPAALWKWIKKIACRAHFLFNKDLTKNYRFKALIIRYPIQNHLWFLHQNKRQFLFSAFADIKYHAYLYTFPLEFFAIASTASLVEP